MNLRRFKSLTDMLAAFPDEQACRDHLTAIRWRDGAFCPHCGCRTVYHFKDGRSHKCRDCRKRFSVTVGTVFESTHISLHKWFIAIYLITSHKKGISSLQLGRDLGVTQKTAWFMLHRLRFASRTKAFSAPLANAVEVDESYIGGKERNKHAWKRNKAARGRSLAAKSAVLAIVERGGNVKAFHVPDVGRGTIQRLMVDNVVLGTPVFTDEYPGYRGLTPFYSHSRVNHNAGQYVVGLASTNTAEGFFSLLKRGIIGIYHHVSVKHLHRYLNEFTFRYNHRDQENSAGFYSLIENCAGRLTYEALIA